MSSVINLFHLLYTAIPQGIRPVTSQLVTLATYVKYENLDLIIDIWKRKGGDLNWMEVSKLKANIWGFVTSSGLLLDVWRLLFTDRNRFSKILNVSVDKKTQPSIYFKIRDRNLKTLSRTLETHGKVLERTRGSMESLKSSTECLKSSATCLL